MHLETVCKHVERSVLSIYWEISIYYSSSTVARHLKSRHPFVSAAQQLISFSDNNIRAAQWADHQWNAEWADNFTRLHTSNLDTGTHTPRMGEEPGSGSTASAPVLDVSAPACTNGIWPPPRPVSVAQNKPSTMSSSTVQSIDPHGPRGLTTTFSRIN